MPACYADEIQRLAQDLGFALVGVTPAGPTEFEAYIGDWLDQEKHGQMGYLAKNINLRMDPQQLLPGAQSVICVADRYPSHRPSPASPQPHGRIARYAWGDDYHRVIKKRLFELADRLRERYAGYDYKVAVDTAPLLEREHAQRAGLGWIGKHTLLIHPRVGSWLLLGAVVTTLPIKTSVSLQPPEAPTNHCGTCTRCIDACPTDCISGYQLDAARCISYLTIEHRGPIDSSLHPKMGDWIAGCDICQEVCPFNHPERIDSCLDPAPPTPRFHPRYTPRPPSPAVNLLEVLGWGPDERREAFKGSALKRIKLDALKRNALIAAGNYLVTSDDEKLLHMVKTLADDPDQPHLVRHTAQQVLGRLASKTASSEHGQSTWCVQYEPRP